MPASTPRSRAGPAHADAHWANADLPTASARALRRRPRHGRGLSDPHRGFTASRRHRRDTHRGVAAPRSGRRRKPARSGAGLIAAVVADYDSAPSWLNRVPGMSALCRRGRAHSGEQRRQDQRPAASGPSRRVYAAADHRDQSSNSASPGAGRPRRRHPRRHPIVCT